jgi:5'-nucleotidase
MVGDKSDYFHRIPYWVDGVEVPAYHLDASPALVVRHALAVFYEGRLPDLVVSGINYGENLGSNVTISGTVGAAFQAASEGIPAIAVSRQTDIEHHYVYGDLDWEGPTRVARSYAERLLAAWADGAREVGFPFDVLKLDIPYHCPPGTEKRMTRLSRKHYFYSTLPEVRTDSRPEESVTSINGNAADLDPDEDIYAVAVDGVVSVTPLTLDCTASLERTGKLFGDSFRALSESKPSVSSW